MSHAIFSMHGLKLGASLETFAGTLANEWKTQQWELQRLFTCLNLLSNAAWFLWHHPVRHTTR